MFLEGHLQARTVADPLLELGQIGVRRQDQPLERTVDREHEVLLGLRLQGCAVQIDGQVTDEAVLAEDHAIGQVGRSDLDARAAPRTAATARSRRGRIVMPSRWFEPRMRHPPSAIAPVEVAA